MTTPWFGLALAAGMALSPTILPISARAADRTTVGVGTGAVAGALVAGPVGAVVGAVAGGFIGANSSDAQPRRHRRARIATRRSAVALRPAPQVAREASALPASEISTAAGADSTGGTRTGWRDPR